MYDFIWIYFEMIIFNYIYSTFTNSWGSQQSTPLTTIGGWHYVHIHFCMIFNYTSFNTHWMHIVGK